MGPGDSFFKRRLQSFQAIFGLRPLIIQCGVFTTPANFLDGVLITIVNGYKLLTALSKNTILDACESSGYAAKFLIHVKTKCSRFGILLYSLLEKNIEIFRNFFLFELLLLNNNKFY